MPPNNCSPWAEPAHSAGWSTTSRRKNPSWTRRRCRRSACSAAINSVCTIRVRTIIGAGSRSSRTGERSGRSLILEGRADIYQNARTTPAVRAEPVARVFDAPLSVGLVAATAGVRPRAVRKWVAPYQTEGLHSLTDRRSRRPHRQPRATPYRMAGRAGEESGFAGAWEEEPSKQGSLEVDHRYTMFLKKRFQRQPVLF